MVESRYINALELSRELGLPLAWVKAEARAGHLPCLLIGRRRLFDLDAVRAELAARVQGGRAAVVTP